jgi:diguanylate cyclase (GGDEF)-like protein/PAS domain S-box-containing protein
MPASVLLIQPDQKQSQRLQQMLFDMGLQSRALRSGEEALLELKAGKPADLVLLELSLPGMDGYKLLKEIRKIRKPAQTAAVVVTAFPAMMAQALRLKQELGIASVASAQATAVTLSGVIQAALKSRTGAQPASMNIPTAAFNMLAKGKEAKRLTRIAALQLTKDLPQDEALDKLVRETALAFDFPVALISVVLEDKQYFKSHVGLKGKLAEDPSLPRDWSFCTHVVDSEPPSALVVPDPRNHPLFEANPLVLGGLVGSYVGVPIVTLDNLVLGTLCLVDHTARMVSADELDLLGALARRVAGEIELRHLKLDRSEQWDKAVEREQRFDMLKAALESLHLGIMLHDKERRIVLANDRLCELTGFQRSYVEKSDCESFNVDLLALLDNPDSFAHKMKILDEGPYVANEIFQMHHPRRQILRWTARPISVGEDWYEICTYEDLTAEIDLEVSRERLATIDPVTELLNRRGGEEELAREAQRAKRKKRSFTILRLELNGLAVINQKTGYDAGDAALREVGACLRRCLRIVDRPARWGGRQFMVLLPETNAAEARIVAERICAAVAALEGPLPLVMCGGMGFSGQHHDVSASLDLAERSLALARNASPGQVF